MTKPLILILAIIGGVSGASALAAPGEFWEVTTKMEMPGMPFAMPANTQKLCIPTGTENDPTHSSGDKDCKMSDVSISGNKSSWKVRCDHNGEIMTGIGEQTTSPDGYQGKMQLSGTKQSWICQRVELNAMSAGQLVNYVDQGISRAIDAQSLDKKVIPPEAVLTDKANELFKHDLDAKVDQTISQLLKVGRMKAQLLKIVGGVFDDQQFIPDVNEYLADNELETWGDSMQVIVDEKLAAINDDVESKITELVTAAIKAA